ncbi:hypothetical protein [Nostoc sp.]|uniref:hypothetical protein n=1 Tax=Nostoc sp. TaxID=1180 RepID=UPI002FF9F0DF
MNYPILPSAEGWASNFTEECRILGLRPRIGLTSSPLALASPVPEEDRILMSVTAIAETVKAAYVDAIALNLTQNSERVAVRG